ncbi:putative signal peptide-containing protein [Cryptosporidium hominis]
MIRIGGFRVNMGLKALLGCILLISGLLSIVDESFDVITVAGSESYPSQSQMEPSNSSSYANSAVLGDEETESSTKSQAESGVSQENSAMNFETSNDKGSSEPLPDGASLYQDETSLAIDDSLPEGLPNAPKTTSPEGVIEYGYNNIQESSVDAKSSDSARDRSEFSDPVIMESLENVPAKTDSSQASFETFDGSILEKELSKNLKQIKTQDQLLEPLTENIEVTGSPLKTPRTDSLSEASAQGAHAMHADSHMKSPPKSPDDFAINDYEINVEANPIDQKEVSQDPTGSEVVFEDTSESKLPTFVTKEGDSRASQLGESSQLTSGISEVSESSSGNLINIESSSLFSQKEGKNTHKKDQEQTPLSVDISKSQDFSIKAKKENLDNSLGFEESKTSERSSSIGKLNTADSSFLNPNTEDITMIPSYTETSAIAGPNQVSQSAQIEPSKTASISVEPPSPPISAIEERTVGNKRIYSGPYVRTSATAGKVSPRIASVINTLVGQFEKLNLYGAGNRNEEVKSGQQNVPNKFVSSMKSNFDNTSRGFSDFVPQNSQEEEFIQGLKNEPAKNTFIFKNRYEEMKNTQSTSGKTLLQEEIEKLRGTYRSTLSKQFSTGKTWERPSGAQGNNNLLKVTYSGDEFLEKVKQINPRFNEVESHSAEATKEADNKTLQEYYPEQSESEEKTRITETGHFSKQESPVFAASNPTESITEKIPESEETTNEGYSDAESFSRRLATGFEDSDPSSMDETQLNFNLQKAEEDSISDNSPKGTQNNGELNTNGFGNMPFSYINTVKELPVGLKPQDAPATDIPEAIIERRSQIDGSEGQTDQSEYPNYNKEASISYSKDVELSPEQEKEINVCYNKAKKIKTINFGLDLTENPNSVVTETFINEFTKYRPKIRELINFGQETLRVAEKYNKKKSWRKKTRKFKLEFLELSNEFLQHTKAIRSLLHHLIQVTNPNIMDILQQIITGHNHSKQNLLVQCKILYQAFYSYKNSVRSRLLKKISDLNFVEVLNNQIKVYLEQRFNPIVKAIKSNKYLKKKLSKQIPDVTILMNTNQYPELSQIGGGEQITPSSKKGNKFTRFFKRLFKKPSCIRCVKSKKQSKKQKSNNKKSN